MTQFLPRGNDAVLEEDEMLLLSLDRGATVLHVFVVFVSCLELLTAFWADAEDKSIAVVVRPVSVVAGFAAGGIIIVPLALLFLHDSRIFLLLIASTLCLFNTLGLCSSVVTCPVLLLSIFPLDDVETELISLLELATSVSFIDSVKEDSLDPCLCEAVTPARCLTQFPKGGEDGGDTHALPLL